VNKAQIFDFFLFFTALGLALGFGTIPIDKHTYAAALLLYWLFSSLYYHQVVSNRKKNFTIEYGISFTSSMGMFAGPLGVFLFETVFRFTVYLYKKWTRTADPEEFLDIFYNIGAFSIISTVAYYLYRLLGPLFDSIPFGFWVLMLLINIIISLLSSLMLSIVLRLYREVSTLGEMLQFILRSRSPIDFGKVALTNGFLLVFLEEGRWELVIIMFLFNYMVSLSFYSKAQSIHDKAERDQFKKMALNDFLTGLANRASMDAKMAELDGSDEYIGIIVTDIDQFKQVNDSFNHAVGDRVLQHFSSLLKTRIPGDACTFRSGGEEFTLILRKRSYAACSELIQALRTEVENSPVPVEYNGEAASISYTVSFGLYYFKATTPFSMEKAYIAADQLLLEAKRAGRNRVSALNALEKEEQRD